MQLRAGDTIVVGGVRQAWVNRTSDMSRPVDVSVAFAEGPAEA